MPRLLSALTTAAAAGACTALVLAQETVPAGRALAAAPAAEESNAPANTTPEPGAVESASSRPAHNRTAAGKKPPQLPSAEAAPPPTPTPKPHKPSFFERVFGRRYPKATPKPIPTPTPTPAYRSGHKGAAAAPPATPVPTATPKPGKPVAAGKKPDHGPKPEKPPEATPAPQKPDTAAKPSPATPAPLPSPSATPPVGKKSRTKGAKAGAATPAPDATAEADPEVTEKAHFEAARAKAQEDPQIKSLKAKADEATTDEDSKKALRAYNKALFEKIRKIDSSVTDRANQLEAAILKRLNE